MKKYMRSPTPPALNATQSMQNIIADDHDKGNVINDSHEETEVAPLPATYDANLSATRIIAIEKTSAAQNITNPVANTSEALVPYAVSPLVAGNVSSPGQYSAGAESPQINNRTGEVLPTANTTENITADTHSNNFVNPSRLRVAEAPVVGLVTPPATPCWRGPPRGTTLDNAPTVPSTPGWNSALLNMPGPPVTPRRSPPTNPLPTPVTPQWHRRTRVNVDTGATGPDNTPLSISAGRKASKTVKVEAMDVDDGLLASSTEASSVDQHLSIPATPSTPRRSPRNHSLQTPQTLRKGRDVPTNIGIEANDALNSASTAGGMARAAKRENNADDQLPAPVATKAKATKKLRRSKRLAAKAGKAKAAPRPRPKRVRSGPKVKCTIVGRFISGGRWKCCIRGCGFVTTNSHKRGGHKVMHMRARAKGLRA